MRYIKINSIFSFSIILLFLSFISFSYAGSFFDSSFTNFDISLTDTSKLSSTDSLYLKVSHENILPMWGPLPLNTGNTTKYPCVVNFSADTFNTFWLNKTPSSGIRRCMFYVNDSMAVKGSVLNPLGGYSTLSGVKYFYASSNHDKDWLLSWHDDNNKDWVINNNAKGLQFYNSVTNRSNPANAMAYNDTGHIVYTNSNNNTLFLKTVNSSTTSISQIDLQTIATTTGAGGDQTRNPFAQVDSLGNILILWRQGTNYPGNALIYNILEPTRNLANMKTGTVDTDICDGDISLYYYPDAKAHSYAKRKFAVVYWKNNSVKMSLLNFASDLTLSSSSIVDISSSGRFPTVCGSSKYLFVTWNQDVGAGVFKIRSKRFSITNGSVNLADTTSLFLSSTSVERSDSTSQIQTALDEKGNLMAVWAVPDSAMGGVFTNKPIRYLSGTYTSMPESVGTNGVYAQSGDSVDFISFKSYPDTAFTFSRGLKANYNLEIRTGASLLSMGTWTRADKNGNFLATNVNGNYKYFQYRLNLNAQDSLFTPRVDSVKFKWNVKPKITGCDSIIINGNKSNLTNGDTIPLKYRVDSLSLFFSARDPDNNQNLQWQLKHTNNNLALTNSSSPGIYNKSFTISTNSIPLGVVTCTLSVTDSLSKSATGFIFFINATNKAPVITACDSIFVNGIKSNLIIGDTVTLRDRIDSLNLFFSASDQDNNINLQWQLKHTSNILALTNSSSPGIYNKSFTISPYTTKLGIVLCTLSVYDSINTSLTPFTFFINSVNITPTCSVVAIADTIGSNILQRDTITLKDSGFISAQSTDTTFYHIYYADDNDVNLGFSLYKNGVKIDTAHGSNQYHYIFANSNVLSGFAKFEFKFFDIDTLIIFTTWVGVNHPPAIDSIVGPKNNSSLKTNATIKTVPGSTNRFIIKTSDVDIIFGDKLFYKWKLNGLLLAETRETLDVSLSPLTDNNITVIVTDLAGKSDSATYTFVYPYLNTNTPALATARTDFASGLDFIIGGNARDTVSFAIKNSGTLNLALLSIKTKSNISKWLKFRIGNAVLVTQNTNVSNIPQYTIAPNDSIKLVFYIFGDSLKGDGVLNDSLFITTDDYITPLISFSIKVVYNDLPFISKFGFNSNSSALLSKKKNIKTKPYSFPPNASVQFVFNEPLDVSTISSSLTIYSYFDSLKTKTLTPLTGNFVYSPSKDSITFTPAYNKPSPYFGIKPRAGMFISTDSIKFKITNGITDLAGNKLDIHKEKKRTLYQDTTFSASVDSAPFTVTFTYPDTVNKYASVTSPVWVMFSRNILKSSVDTSLINNKTISIKTRFSSGQPVALSYVVVDSNTLIVKTERAFFNDDSIYVILSGTIKDTMGYSLDADDNGISSYIYDTTSTSDNYSWNFLTEPTPYYIFPNPYTPSKDKRHSEIGGITFKNLNRLTPNGSQLDIQIYSLKGILIYSSLRAGENLQIKEGTVFKPPLWVWKTVNQNGRLVASGLYYYVIKNISGVVVAQGKLIIER